MATYSNMKKGVEGEAVSELQRLLNQNGYSLAADGIFGSATQSAVKDYQAKNNLTVDGIVGNQTWSSLFGTKASTAAPTPESNPTVNYLTEYGSRPSYSQSPRVGSAANTLTQHDASKPAAFQSAYADQIQGVLDKIMNREKFNYDFASDPIYQQYADKYQQQGKLAMMDTMGQAAALSGGYGNTYAQSVGQQAYQQNLGQLNDIIPELRNAAYQMYQDEGSEMYNQMGALQGLDNTDYGRYRDTVGDWQYDRDYYTNAYRDERDFDYGQYRDSVSDWDSDRSFGYNASQDALAQSNWEKEFTQSQSNWDKEYALAAQQAAAKASKSSSSSSKKSEAIKYIDGMSSDQLENVALRMWNNSGMSDPRKAVENTKYTTKQKRELLTYLSQLNDYTRR